MLRGPTTPRAACWAAGVSAYREQVAAALRAVTIRGPTRYAGWGGRAGRSPRGARRAWTRRRRGVPGLVPARGALRSFYCHGRPVPARWGEPQPARRIRGWWRRCRRPTAAAGAGRAGGRFSGSTMVRSVVATRALRARVPVGDCATAAVAPAAPFASACRRSFPRFARVLDGARRGAASSAASAEGGVRVYWNVDRSGAPVLVARAHVAAQRRRRAVPAEGRRPPVPARALRCGGAVPDGDVFGALARGARRLARRA